MTKEQQLSADEREELNADQPAAVYTPDVYCIAANNQMEELFNGEIEGELPGCLWEEASDYARVGSMMGTAANGEVITHSGEVGLPDGSYKRVKSRASPLDSGNVLIEWLEIEEVDGESSNAMSKFSDDQIASVASNLRIESPEGEMPLDLAMLDIAVGHNEVEEYKAGALSLYEAIERRLEEERESCEDEQVIETLEDAKDAAFGLYLRIERGDKELVGDRPGKYSNYFQ